MSVTKSQMEQLEECLKSVRAGIDDAKQGNVDSAEQILRELQQRYAQVSALRQQNKMAS